MSGRWSSRPSARGGAKRAAGSPRYFAICLMAVFGSLGAPLRSRAQLPQLQAPPNWGKVPQGSGACSVEKSCADLAPGMIRDALGASTVEKNVGELARILTPAADEAAGKRAASWVEAALGRSGADEVRVERIGASHPFEFVEAEIRGRDFPGDYVLLAAPLFRNGSANLAVAENVAVLVDAVRVIHTTGNIPRRSIRFVFYPAETERSGGNFAAIWAYMHQHQGDLDHIAAAISIDAARGPLDGYSLGDRPEMVAAVREALEPLRSVGVDNFSESVQVDADTMPLWLEGIPTMVATSPGEKRTSGDSPQGSSAPGSLRAAKLRQLKRGVAVAAVTAYALADAETRIGARRSPAEVQRSIASLGLEGQMKAAGLGAEWEKVRAQENH